MKKSVYISRPVLNGAEIREWARQQGFYSCLPDEAMHVTVAFDSRKHLWRDLPAEPRMNIDIMNLAERSVEEFKHGAIVLELYSLELTTRWAELLQSGLNWKWPDYRPHVTLTYNRPPGLDLSRIEPFGEVIRLGPEIMEEVCWRPQQTIMEVALNTTEA